MGLTEKFTRHTQKFTDYKGDTIAFDIHLERLPTGYLVVGEEVDSSRGERLGYVVSAFSAVNPDLATAKLHDKIRHELNVRYLVRLADGTRQLTQQTTRFRIARDGDEMVLEINGDKVEKNEFFQLLTQYEGWEGSFSISYPE